MSRKIANFFNRIKVQYQLYIMYFLVIFIPLLAVGSYLVYNTTSLLRSHYVELAQADSQRVRSLLLDLTSNIYAKAQSVAADDRLTALLGMEYMSATEAKKDMEAYTAFDALLSQDISIADISLYTENSTLPNGKYIHPLSDECRTNSWFPQAYTTATPFWSVIKVPDDFGNEHLTLCLHTRIYIAARGEFAILNFTVSNNHMKNRIENTSLRTVLWLNDQQVFYNSTRGENPAPDIYAYTPAFGKSNAGEMSICGTNMIGCVTSLVTAQPIKSKNCFYIASLNSTGYTYIKKITHMYLIVLTLILIVTSVFIYLFSRYFSRRVNTLRRAMHQASLGQYQVTDHYNGKDEISDAFTDLNHMIGDILSKEASIYESQLRAKELANQQQQMEFKMLSSQINPHFLYNTLETIRMRAICAQNRDVADAIKLLGKSMRYVLQNTAIAFTTLSRELDYIETYLAIQKLRFHDRVNYTLKICSPIDTGEYEIFPLLLQPIVENAIIHGLEEVETHGKIIIHIADHKDRLTITIFDNGCGMTKEEILAVEDNIYHHPDNSEKSIGLYNICHRIQLCYGPDYGIHIQSKKGTGTAVTLLLPARRMSGRKG